MLFHFEISAGVPFDGHFVNTRDFPSGTIKLPCSVWYNKNDENVKYRNLRREMISRNENNEIAFTCMIKFLNSLYGYIYIQFLVSEVCYSKQEITECLCIIYIQF